MTADPPDILDDEPNAFAEASSDWLVDATLEFSECEVEP